MLIKFTLLSTLMFLITGTFMISALLTNSGEYGLKNKLTSNGFLTPDLQQEAKLTEGNENV